MQDVSTRSCHFTAQWVAADNLVLISVPQRCLRLVDGQRRYVRRPAASTGTTDMQPDWLAAKCTSRAQTF